MAEYYMTYDELSDVLDDLIEKATDNENLYKYKAEILAALTGNYDRNDYDSVNENVTLWENQLSNNSEAVFGTRYIRVQSIMLSCLGTLCTSGLLDAVIMYAVTGNVSGFSISVGATVTIAIWELFNLVKKLDDWDFCIYMQAATHFREHKEFTKNDLIDWLPGPEKNICNMHDSRWDCDYRTDKDECDIINQNAIDDSIESLISKNLLEKNKEKRGTYTFKFKH